MSSQAGWQDFDFGRPDRTKGGVGLCGGCRRSRICRLGVLTERLDEDGVLRCNVVCGEGHEGGPGVAHGGWTAAVLDEILGHVAPLHGVLAVTGTLSVRYLKPTPTGRPLTGRATVDRRDGVKWHISGALSLASSGVDLAVASGIWIERPPQDHFVAFERWLHEQDRRPGDS